MVKKVPGYSLWVDPNGLHQISVHSGFLWNDQTGEANDTFEVQPPWNWLRKLFGLPLKPLLKQRHMFLHAIPPKVTFNVYEKELAWLFTTRRDAHKFAQLLADLKPTKETNHENK